MPSLSVLVFSKDNAAKAIDLARDVYGIADEVVLVDSSGPAETKRLLDGKRRGKLSRLRIHHAVALGYVEPLRMYGIKMCRGDWVLYLDTDERITKELKGAVREIIGRATCSAFSVKRYEHVTDKVDAGAFTWQTRIFRRGRAIYRGMLHEQPIIMGRTETLPDQYAIKHLAGLQNPERGDEYSKMDRFERLSYSMYNDAVLNYARRLNASDPESTLPAPARLVHWLLVFYERITMKKPESEIGWLGYFALFCTREAMLAVRKKTLLHDIWHIPGAAMVHADRISALRHTEQGMEDFEVSKIMGSVGLIKFLGLDDVHTMERLNTVYGKGRQGITLTFDLIHKAYLRSRKNAGTG